MGAEAMGIPSAFAAGSNTGFRQPLTETRIQDNMANKRPVTQPISGPHEAVKQTKVEARPHSEADELLGRRSMQPLVPATTEASGFACFHLTGQPSRQLPDSAYPETGCGAMQTSLTTFADLAMNAGSQGNTDQASLDARKSSLLALRLTNPSTRPPLAPSTTTQPVPVAAPRTSAPMPSAASAQGEPAPAQPAQLVVSHCLIYDWAPKSSVRFTSSHRFVAYDASTVASVRHSVNAGTTSLRQHWRALPVQEQWQAALTSWRHPHQSWDTATVAALQQATPALLEQRLQAWRQAFTSAYMAVRHGQASAVYLDMSQGSSKQLCTILFCAPGTRGCAQPHALLSTSSHQLRARLTAAGVTYSAPLAPATQSRQDAPAARTSAPEDDDEEWFPHAGAAAASGGSTAVAAAVKDHAPKSVLLVVGPEAVHMLFDWLLQEAGYSGWQAGEVMDLPVLWSPLAFHGACATRPDVKSTTITHIVGHQAPQQQHMLELLGPVPPWVLCRVCGVLGEAAVSQGQTFQVDLTTPEHNLSLNVWVPGAASGADAATGGWVGVGGSQASGSGGWEVVPGERGAVCAAVPELHRRVAQRVTVDTQRAGGQRDSCGVQFTVRLSG